MAANAMARPAARSTTAAMAISAPAPEPGSGGSPSERTRAVGSPAGVMASVR